MQKISKKNRKNNFPVILVHGTLGFVNDQNALVRSYWHTMFSVLGKWINLIKFNFLIRVTQKCRFTLYCALNI